MTYEAYRYIFIIGAVLSAVMLLTSVLLFFLLKIPRVVGDLSGATARRAIKDIRNQNEQSGDKLFKTSHVNRERGRITDRMTPSGRLLRTEEGRNGGAMATEKISTMRLQQEAPSAETTVLNAASEETTVLYQAPPETPCQAEAPVFEIEYEITFLHTEEIIA